MVKSAINFAIKYTGDIVGFGAKKTPKVSTLLGIKYAPLRFKSGFCQDVAQLSKAKGVFSPKRVILKAIGEDAKIYKDWQDLGYGWEGIKAVFSKKSSHYAYTKPIGGKKLYERGEVSCYYDQNNLLDRFYVFDWNTKSLRHFDKNGKLVTQYTPKETKAIFRYKSDSKDVHKILREGKSVKKEIEVQDDINALTQVFQKGKTCKTEGQIVAYRALDKTSLNKILSMSEDGMIFVDPSFMSVATDKRSVYPFLNMRNYNHIMQVIIPKDTKYLKMDELGHVIIPQKAENELVLEAGSRLLIKKRAGMIVAELLKN